MRVTMSSEESATCLHSVAHTAGWESGFPRIDESSSDFPKIGQKETSSVLKPNPMISM